MKSAIVDRIETQPGVHFNDLCERVGCSSTTADYHIRNTDDIKDRSIRNYRRLYPDSVPERYTSPLAALNHEIRGQVLLQLRKEPNQFSDLAGHFEIANSTLSYHLQVLQGAELVEVAHEGPSTEYRLVPLTRDTLSRYGQQIVEIMTDGFIDLWE